MRNGYRLSIKVKGKWHVGLVSYATLEEVIDRKQHMISIGTRDKDIKIVTDEEIFG